MKNNLCIRKNCYLHLLTIMVISMLSVSLLSCGKDDDEEEKKDDFEQTEKLSVQDPEGTVVLNMNNGSEGNYYKIAGMGEIHIDAANNLEGYKLDEKDIKDYRISQYYDISFVSIGKVDGLSKVTQIPSSGWAKNAAVVPGTGYVMCSVLYVETKNSWGGINGYEPQSAQYARIYAVDNLGLTTTDYDDGYSETTGSVTGATIKYQTPFKGIDEEINVESSVAFSATGGTQVLIFNNKSIIPFTMSSSQPWCHVTTASTNEYNLPNGIAVSVDETNSAQQDTATVTIKTLYGKEKRVKVTREAIGAFIELYNDYDMAFLAVDNEPHNLYFYSNAEKDQIKVSCSESWCKTKLTDVSEVRAAQARQIKYIGQKKVNGYEEGSIRRYQLEVSVEDNTTDRREAEIQIKSKDGNASLSIPVTQEGYTFGLGQSNIQIGASAQTYKIQITGTAPTEKLQVSSNESWCKVSIIDATTNPEDNLGTQRYMEVEVEKNTSEKSRTAVVSLKMKNSKNSYTCTVLQEGIYLNFSDTQLSFDRKSNYQTVNITTNFSDWKPISSDDSWCKISWTGSTLTIRVDETTENREATISFEGFESKITIKQNRYAVDDTYDEDGISGTVGYISFDKCYIYKLLGEYAWSTEYVPTGANDWDDGRKNMEVIKKIPDYEKYYPAFAACEALNVDGVTGWYIPAYHEILSQFGYDYASSTERNEYYIYCGGGKSYSSDSYYLDGIWHYLYYDHKTNIKNIYAIHLFE